MKGTTTHTLAAVIRGILAIVVVATVACGSIQPREAMSDGQRLYYDKCTSCHDAYEPHEFSPDKWRESVHEMEADGRVVLTAEDRALLLGYLTGRPAVVTAAR